YSKYMKGILIGFITFSVLLTTSFFVANLSPDEADVPVADTIKTPEEELAGFKLPEGFVIELVASERDGIVNPIDLTFDDAGRLWTQTARMYPLDPVMDIK